MANRSLSRWVVGGAGIVVALGSRTALAQSWSGARDDPSVREIIAVDATGEPRWPYGAEDVTGDGVARFEAEEQALDIRSAYATTDPNQLWIRLYVSATSAPADDLGAFVFVDADANASTGGSMVADAIDPCLTVAGPRGGYEYVVGLLGDATVIDIWEWQAASAEFVPVTGGVAGADAEVGIAPDPIFRARGDHGYWQVAVDLDRVGLTAACDGRVALRTVQSDATSCLVTGDLTSAGPCVPADDDANRVPDLLVPTQGCQTDADCPNFGVCIGTTCVIAPPCVTDADCESGEACSTDGICVAVGGEACDADADCAGLVCVAGSCGPCGTDADCGADLFCAPDGRCIPAPQGTPADGGPLDLAPGEEIRGGAGTCATGRGHGAWGLLLILAVFARIARRRAWR